MCIYFGVVLFWGNPTKALVISNNNNNNDFGVGAKLVMLVSHTNLAQV